MTSATPPAARSEEVSTARSYVLVGFIFYVLGIAGWLIGAVFFLFTTAFWIGEVPPEVPKFFPGFFPLIPMGVLAAASAGFTAWAWMTLRNVDAGRLAEARTASLVLGIVGLFLAWLVGGIFFLLASGKLEEAVRPALVPQRFCVSCGRAVAPDARFCPHCGKELPP